MDKKFVLKLMLGYVAAGLLWLVGGTWLIDQLKLHDYFAGFDLALVIKNILFLVVSVITLVYIVANYYSQLLARQTILNRQLTESEGRLRHLLNTYEYVMKATNDVIWDYDIANNKLKWLSGYSEVFGYASDDELPVENAFWNMNRIHEDDRKATIESFKTVLEGKERKWNAEYRYLCADGAYKYVADRGYLILDEHGEPVRMLGAMQDIDVRKNYGLRLEAQNEKLKEIAWLNSHEIRRPLCNMLGLMPMVKANVNDDAALPELINYLETSANELDETVKRINAQVCF